MKPRVVVVFWEQLCLIGCGLWSRLVKEGSTEGYHLLEGVGMKEGGGLYSTDA